MHYSESEAVTLTREQLYKQVWKQSAVQLAKEYGISDVALAKACKKHQIPKPPLGYWAKILHGQTVHRPPLPTVEDPRLQVIHFTPNPEAQRNREVSASIDQKAREEVSRGNKIVVPTTLEAPHALVVRTERALRSATPSHAGIRQPSRDGYLDVAIGVESIGRAMRILDTLIKTAESLGMKAKRYQSKHGDVVGIEVEGEMVSLQMTELLGERLRELTDEQKLENEKYPVVKPHSPTELYPRGLLVLSFVGATRSSRRRCSELGGMALEDRLNEISAWLQKEAEKLRVMREEREAEKRRWEEWQQQRAEEERLRRQEAVRIKKLDEDMTAWREAERIRKYAAAVEKAAISKSGSIDQTSEVGQWLAWAKKRADTIDPIKP